LSEERKWYGTKEVAALILFSCLVLSVGDQLVTLILSLQELLEKYASEALIQQSQEAKTLLGL